MMDRRKFLIAAPATLTLPTLAQSDAYNVVRDVTSSVRPSVTLLHNVLKRSVPEGTILKGFQFRCDENGELMEDTVWASAVGADNIPHHSRPFVKSEWVKRKISFVGEV